MLNSGSFTESVIRFAADNPLIGPGTFSILSATLFFLPVMLKAGGGVLPVVKFKIATLQILTLYGFLINFLIPEDEGAAVGMNTS